MDEFIIEYPLYIVNTIECCDYAGFSRKCDKCYCIQNEDELKKIVLCKYNKSIFNCQFTNECCGGDKNCKTCIKHKKDCNGCLQYNKLTRLHTKFIKQFNESNNKLELLKQYTNDNNKLNDGKYEFEVVYGKEVQKLLKLLRCSMYEYTPQKYDKKQREFYWKHVSTFK